MSLIVNTNLTSIVTQKYLSTTQSQLAQATQRLASGLRINSASDDAAGYAIAQRLTAQVNGANTAVQNTNNAVSLAQTAQGSLAEITNNLQRVRELAVESANATNSTSDRSSLNNEAQQLLQEVDRVATTASFNGVKLLDGSFTSAQFQVGANAGDTITIGSISSANTAALGTVTSATGQSSATSGISALGAVGAGALIINGTDVGAGIGAAGSIQDRVGQVVDAINASATTTGVNASFDAVNGKIVLTSASTIAVTGTDDGTATGFNVAGGDGSATAATSTGLTSLSLNSFAGASLAIQQIDSALNQINTANASLGAYQNRFQSAVANLQSTSQNLTAARSTIQDADFASETANETRASVLQQAGVAVLGQANSQPQQILSLLQHL
ncbi:flagellin [Nevskia soli]|uniref:flagellin N-terminal helical domain-containing protein n=1 Tax=Nevskia soli TaxID=418856 RepID=UPI0004A75D70|nr:flagellin [Nevskia soli]